MLNQVQLPPRCPAQMQRPVAPGFDESMGRHPARGPHHGRAHTAIEALVVGTPPRRQSGQRRLRLDHSGQRRRFGSLGSGLGAGATPGHGCGPARLCQAGSGSGLGFQRWSDHGGPSGSQRSERQQAAATGTCRRRGTRLGTLRGRSVDQALLYDAPGFSGADCNRAARPSKPPPVPRSRFPSLTRLGRVARRYFRASAKPPRARDRGAHIKTAPTIKVGLAARCGQSDAQIALR